MNSRYNSREEHVDPLELERCTPKLNGIRKFHGMRNLIGNSHFISIIILIIGFTVGVLIGLDFDVPTPAELIINEPPSQQWLFQNNSQVALGLCLGGLTFGIITILILLFNGLLLGLWFQERIRSQGVFIALILVLPHGVFEIPALLLAGSVGIDVTRWVFRSVFSNSSSESDLLDTEGKSSKVLIRRLILRVIVVGSLLFVASVVEAYITPLFAIVFI